jgi:hypothetical protein
MKKAVAAFFMLSCISCSKEKAPELFGSYKGNIEVYVNNAKQTVLPGYGVQINPSIDKNKITISHNVLFSATASLSGNQLSIPKATVGTGPDLAIMEYGTGTFANQQLRIEFVQEYVVNGTVSSTTKWTGTLSRE